LSPILFEWFGLSFYAWGLAAALGFGAVAGFALLRAKQANVSTNRVADLLFYGAIAGLFGARLGYFATHWDELTSIGTFFNPRQGGASMYGAAFFILPLFFWLCHRYQLHPKNIADIYAPGLAIGLAIHRLGCLGTGCCYGAGCDLPWAIDLHGQSVHPTQLYEAIPLALLAAVLLWRWDKRAYVGQITWFFALGYAPIRFLGEMFRGSPERGFLWGESISVAQGATVVFFAIAWFWLRPKPDTQSLEKSKG